MGTKQASTEWGYEQSTISRWCREGLINGAEHDGTGSPWRIPVDTECPRPVKKKGQSFFLCDTLAADPAA